MSTPSDPEGLNDAPQAHSVRPFFCANPKCLRPHVALFDDHGRCIAHFVVPDLRPDGTGFLKDLQAMAYRSVVMRNAAEENTDGD